MSIYIPPSSTQLPFTFTDSGYTSPTGELLFKFITKTSGLGNLGAVIQAMKPSGDKDLSGSTQAMQLYNDETYTYVKSCPKYVVGYSGGVVQIMKGRCIFGGIRGLRSSVVCDPSIFSQIVDLSGTIKIIRFGIYDLSFNIAAHLSENIMGTIKPVHKVVSNLPVSISMHLPENIRGTIKPVHKVVSNLPVSISMHLPENIRGIIKPIHHVVLDFPGSVYGWQKLDLYSNILIHPPKDLEANLFVKRTEFSNLNTFIHAWHVKDLGARVDRVFPIDLQVILNTILPVDLSAYLKTRYAINLKGSLSAWNIKDLSATIDIIFSYDLNIKIYGRDDMFKDLYSRIKGRAVEVQRFLSASLRGLVGNSLSALLIPVYISNLPGYLFPVLPKDISANIYAWHVLDLQGILNGQRAEWDLLASIFPNRNLSTLNATLYSKFGTKIPSNLPANIHSWYINYLTSSIGVIAAGNLQAILIPFGHSSNLNASIYPKMIRLTTIIKVATMEHKDLSAMINSFCIHTGCKNLSASLYTTYKSDLFAYIKALKYSYKLQLSASVGYADTITEVDKYRINFTVLESSMRTFDRYMIGFSVFGSVTYLSAYIKGILRSVSLGASIVAEEIETFNVGKLQNVEHVVHLSYAGVFNTYEVVEMAFKSLVNDYYYSTDGDYAWKMNRFDRWLLEIKSYLPKNEDLRLKRRLHKGTELYDLKRFSSIDEAMRHAIAYVTEYPQSNLMGSIYGIGMHTSLGATIRPIYTKTRASYLGGMLTSVVPTIIVGIEQDGIEKI